MTATRTLTLTLGTALLLAGCSYSSNEAAAKPDNNAPTACGVKRVLGHVGHIADPAMRAVIERDSGATAVRWITPDSAVTMDYREDRLNVYLGDKNRITKMSCG